MITKIVSLSFLTNPEKIKRAILNSNEVARRHFGECALDVRYLAAFHDVNTDFKPLDDTFVEYIHDDKNTFFSLWKLTSFNQLFDFSDHFGSESVWELTPAETLTLMEYCFYNRQGCTKLEAVSDTCNEQIWWKIHHGECFTHIETCFGISLFMFPPDVDMDDMDVRRKVRLTLRQ